MQSSCAFLTILSGGSVVARAWCGASAGRFRAAANLNIVPEIAPRRAQIGLATISSGTTSSLIFTVPCSAEYETSTAQPGPNGRPTSEMKVQAARNQLGLGWFAVLWR